MGALALPNKVLKVNVLESIGIAPPSHNIQPAGAAVPINGMIEPVGTPLLAAYAKGTRLKTSLEISVAPSLIFKYNS